MKRIEFGELQIGEEARANLLHVCDTNWAFSDTGEVLQ